MQNSISNQLTPSTMACVLLVDSLPTGATKREYYLSDISTDIGAKYYGALPYFDGCFYIAKNSNELDAFMDALLAYKKAVDENHIKSTQLYNIRMTKHKEQIESMDKQGYKLEFAGNGKEAKEATFYPHSKNSFQHQEAGSLQWVKK